ncbi:MAG: SDR family NAD(P)-dependent oxidoreductase [Bacteroidales bacterium]
MSKVSDHYAIVTGASSGLGKAFAEELARRGHNLLLASLPGTGLPVLSDELHARHDVEVRFIETDLMRAEAPGEIKRFVADHNLEVDVLINNVGIGHGGAIGEYSEAAIEESFLLNMKCTTRMTNLFVEELKKRERAYILNMGSFGGLMPIPYKSIYSATKSYLYHFSLAIREELRSEGISVSVAMPGPVLTNAQVRERNRRLGLISRSNVIEADEAAAYMIRMMYRSKGVILPRFTIRVSYAIGCFLPYRLLLVLLGRIFKGVS